MNDYISYKCTNCGAIMKHITGNIIKCEHCGTEYYKENDTLVVKTCKVPLITLAARRCVPEELLTGEKEQRTRLIEYTLHEMASQISEKLVEQMEITTSHEPLQKMMFIEGKVRVAQPTRDESFMDWLVGDMGSPDMFWK